DTINRQRLQNGHRGIRSPRRQVHKKIVKLFPIHIAIELLNSAGDHWPTPHHGITLVLKEHVHRHDLDTTSAGQGLNTPTRRFSWLASRSKHAGYAGAGNITIKNTHAQALA